MLQNKLKNKKLILASGSPRRRELMAGAGLEFEVAAVEGVEERFPAGMQPFRVPQYLAKLKSNAYPITLNANEILITADTVVILGGEIIGKPADREDAIKMLGRLSGREHTVITGVHLRSAEKNLNFRATSRVKFRQLSQDEIVYYVDKFQPYDKAGAYGIQEWIGYVGVEGVKGSFFNVMGLPIQLLYVNLLKFNE